MCSAGSVADCKNWWSKEDKIKHCLYFDFSLDVSKEELAPSAKKPSYADNDASIAVEENDITIFFPLSDEPSDENF